MCRRRGCQFPRNERGLYCSSACAVVRDCYISLLNADETFANECNTYLREVVTILDDRKEPFHRVACLDELFQLRDALKAEA